MSALTMHYGAASDTGLRRRHNEDRFYADPAMGLYLVCDGMGGHRAGEVASARAVECIRDHIATAARESDHPLIGVYRPEFSASTNRLASAVRAANLSVYRESLHQPSFAGMGTTVAAVLVREHIVSIAHVGDSRVYLKRNDTLHCLTCDHSVVSEKVRCGLLSVDDVDVSLEKHVLTSAVGIAATVDVELGEIPILSGDLLLLCSDGLNSVKPAQIAQSMQTCGDPQALSDRLIALSNAAGGDDNITAVVVEFVKPRAGIWARLRSRFFSD
ncbi:MAG TPA: protein phosphatase 2C domain-containing protein [Nitrospiraceae bacterium]|nr:protein phosphatase 2C domain-containing protein [Nitrospiraceae bacterium]